MYRNLAFVAALSAAAVASVLPVDAADLGAYPAKAPPYVAQSIHNWSGFYVGGQLGGEFAAKPLDGNVDTGDQNINNFLGSIGDPGSLGPNAVGFMGGAHIGLNYQVSPAFVWGAEIGVEASSLNSSGTAFSSQNIINATAAVSKPWDTYAIVKFGVTAGPRKEFLFYGLGGFAAAQFTQNASINDPFGARNGVPAALAQSTNDIHAGWTVGAGLDWAALEHLVVGVRYRYSDYGTRGLTIHDPALAAAAGTSDATFNSSIHGADNQFTARVSLFLN